MSLFDFLMPEVAQASHLRKIANASSKANTQSRLQESRNHMLERSKNKRIKELESEVGELTILVEALLERLEENSLITRAGLAQKIAEIDARDGVIDGKITDPNEPLVGETTRGKFKKKPAFKAKLQFPES